MTTVEAFDNLSAAWDKLIDEIKSNMKTTIKIVIHLDEWFLSPIKRRTTNGTNYPAISFLCFSFILWN